LYQHFFDVTWWSKHRPFGRLWWDEIVPTVVTRAEPHNQVIVFTFDII